MIARIIALSVLCLLALAANAGVDTDIAGIWWSPQKDAKIEFFIDTSGKLAGRLIAMPVKTAANMDVHNPEEAQRQRRVLGLVIFSGFRQVTKNHWVDGKVYDPESGGTFSAQIRLEDGDRMMMRGYLGLQLFGRTENFRRVTGAQPQWRQPGEPTLVYMDRPNP
jgi:uncharacterized protein (DUF2147 family)